MTVFGVPAGVPEEKEKSLVMTKIRNKTEPAIMAPNCSCFRRWEVDRDVRAYGGG